MISTRRRDGGLRPVIGLALAALLAGCGESDEASGPGAMTAGEETALEEAATMLDSRPEDEPTSAPSPSEGDGNE